MTVFTASQKIIWETLSSKLFQVNYFLAELIGPINIIPIYIISDKRKSVMRFRKPITYYQTGQVQPGSIATLWHQTSLPL
jgi:hypothetical protein